VPRERMIVTRREVTVRARALPPHGARPVIVERYL
jgi:hypothetical protein